MNDLPAFSIGESEKARTPDLLRILPKNRASILDVGARTGHFSRLLTEYFPAVTALDLHCPNFSYPGVARLAADATNLPFPDGAFDCVLCSEVLEHIPHVERACRELTRVARHELIIGVPFQQDTRSGRTTCGNCGKANPPWGHVHSFDEAKLRRLFPGLSIKTKSLVGETRERTNPLSAFLMDLAGNPWGTYSQKETCIYCGARIDPPASRSMFSRICSAAALRINRVQERFTPPHPIWIHLVLEKP